MYVFSNIQISSTNDWNEHRFIFCKTIDKKYTFFFIKYHIFEQYLIYDNISFLQLPCLTFMTFDNIMWISNFVFKVRLNEHIR